MIKCKNNLIIFVTILALKAKIYGGVKWEHVRCSSDSEQDVPEGKVSNIGRFPWLGIVQHSFFLADEVRFAITGGVLIHPAYVIAPAEDIAKISPEQLMNNTKFIVWRSAEVKYALDVKDYLLHPEYIEKVTFATIALLEILTMGETGTGESVAPVRPICLPVKGSGAFSDLYAVKMTDENKELEKEVLQMNFVENKDCEEFYYKAKLNHKKMAPLSAICAVSEHQKKPCVWDGGVALISRFSWGFWKLLGFSVRGPGCGAPARFLNIHDYLPWLDEIISTKPTEEDLGDDTTKWALRRLSPVEIIMYKTEHVKTLEQGQCDRKGRGSVLYKDSTEITINKNFGQGFFFLSVAQIASFTCLSAILDSTARTNAVMWVEHYCHRELTGLAHGVSSQLHRSNDYAKLECFLYFKSTAFVEFRFYFSFRAQLEVTLHGREETPRMIPNPWATDITTEPWWPTGDPIRWGNFVPYYFWWYWL